MSKRGGMFGVLEKAGLVEGDEPLTHEGAMPAPDLAPAPIITPLSMPVLSATVLDASDQERMKAIEAQVYATPSSYIIFQHTREALGNTSDLATVFKVLVAANPGVTPARVLADIDTHLGVITSKRSEFDAQVEQARTTGIDGAAHEIADLTAQNQAAAAQIADRTARIATLQAASNKAAQSIADGTARFKAIETQLSAPLLQAKQLLSALA